MSDARAAADGVAAVGDSITGGDGAPALGVACRSWAHWLALALDVPFHGLARDGAVVADVVAEQLPRLRGPYAVGAVYVGVNDARSVDFDGGAFAAGLDAVLAAVAGRAARVVVCTIPLDLGRPRAGAAKVGAANATIRAAAAAHGAVVADLDDLAGPLLVLPDAVHPTALGQLEIADRAAAALGLARRPSELVTVHRSRRALARFALTSHAPALARDWRRRVVEGAARRHPRRTW